MNQIGVGLIIGGVVGFGIGLTLAPDVVLPGMSADQQDLLCLEERTQLMDEVRDALKKMEQAQCAPVEPTQEEVIPRAVPVVADTAQPTKPTIKPIVAAVSPEKSVVDAGPAKAKPATSQTATKPAIKAVAKATKPEIKPSEKGVWLVQLIATPDPAQAGKIERKAHALGLETRIVLEQVADQSHSLYKVRIGPFTDKTGGVEALRRVKRELKITGWLHRGD